MIEYDGPGDLFRCGTQTIACPVNAVGVMGAGLAAAFRIKVPGLFEFYRLHYSAQSGPLHERERRLRVFEITPRKKVLLFPTKGDWRKPSRLNLIDANLETLGDTFVDLGITSLGLPRIGCGLGKLDWHASIRPLIYSRFEHHPLPIKLISA